MLMMVLCHVELAGIVCNADDGATELFINFGGGESEIAAAGRECREFYLSLEECNLPNWKCSQ